MARPYRTWQARAARALGLGCLTVLASACGHLPGGDAAGVASPHSATGIGPHSATSIGPHSATGVGGTAPASPPPPAPVARTVAPKLRPVPKPELAKGQHSGLGTLPAQSPWMTPGSPTWVAANWVTGYEEVLWYQGGAGAWAARVKPYCTPAFFNAIGGPRAGALAASASSTAQWSKVVRAHELAQVDILGAYRVDEAGWSSTSETVLVTYATSQRSDADPDSPAGASQPLYLKMTRSGHKWLVASTWAPLG